MPNITKSYSTVIALLSMVAVCSQASAAELLYQVRLENTAGTTLSDVPVTFAHPFLAGDVPAGQTLRGIIVETDTPVDVQIDHRTTHPDGSLRHAVASVVLPSLGVNQTVTLELRPAAAGFSAPAVTVESLKQSGQTVEIDLQIGGQTYRATLAEAIENPVLQWLDGPLASEWITAVPFRHVTSQAAHSDLKARFYARKYAGTNNVKVDVVVENLTTFVGVRQRFDYGAVIRINGNVVYSKGDITHFRNTRWKYTFWTGGEPGVHVAFDPFTLMATRAIPTYDPKLVGDMTNQPDYSGYRGSSYIDHGDGTEIDRYGPMGRGGNSANSMATTGARSEIAPLPEWAVSWILTQTPASKFAMLRNSDLAGSWSIHYRDEYTGFPVTIDAAYGGYPGWGISSGRPDPEPVPSESGSSSPLAEDTAHQPQFSFVPYLVTGDFFHFEELELWAAHNLAETNPGTVAEPDTESGDGYRNLHKGLIINRGQLRARAWNLRTLAMTAAFTPDDYYTKQYWEQILENNIERYYWRYVIKNNYGYGNHRTPDGTQPWMDDYMTWAMYYTLSQGYESARPSAEWKALFSVARMGQGSLNSQWCWQAATDFKLGEHPADGSLWPTINDWWAAYMPDAQGKACNTQAMADAIDVSGPGDMRGRPSSSSSYVAQMSMALAAAVDLGTIGADVAWAIYSGATGERNEFPDFRGSGRFAIVPMHDEQRSWSRPKAPEHLSVH